MNIISRSQQQHRSRSLPLKLCIGWGIGTLGVSIMFNSITILMQRFATDFLGVAATTWGVIFLLSKIYDAITDPIMGAISDKTNSPWGRRRPYLLIGAVISVIAFYCLFNAPSVDESTNAVVLLFAGLLLYSTGYTVFNVPYIAMLAEITDDPIERARLVAYRVYAIGLGTMVGLALGPALIDHFGGDRAAHHTVAIIFSGLSLLVFVLCFYLTKDARQSDPSQQPAGTFSENMKMLWANKPFVQVVGLKVSLLTGVAVNQTLLVYLIVQVLQRDYAFMGVYGGVAAFCTMLGPMLCIKLMRIYDKRNIYIVAALVHAFFMLTWLLSGPNEASAIIVMRGAILGLSAGAMIMIGQAMLPDAINYETYQTGLHREGVYSGIYTTAEKTAFALGGAFSGFILGAAGYISSTAGAVVQPESAVQAIYFCAGVLPAFFAVVSCLFLIGYRLSDAKLDELRQRASFKFTP